MGLSRGGFDVILCTNQISSGIYLEFANPSADRGWTVFVYHPSFRDEVAIFVEILAKGLSWPCSCMRWRKSVLAEVCECGADFVVCEEYPHSCGLAILPLGDAIQFVVAISAGEAEMICQTVALSGCVGADKDGGFAAFDPLAGLEAILVYLVARSEIKHYRQRHVLPGMEEKAREAYQNQ